jgi:GT2 family glycosyltransferase
MTPHWPLHAIQDLDALPLDEVLASLENLLDHHLLGPQAGTAYLDRLLRERNLERRPDATPWLGYLADKTASQAPFDPRRASLAARLAPARWGRFAGYLSSLRADPHLMDLDRAWSDARVREAKRGRLADALRSDPENTALASALLMLDYMDGAPPGSWTRHLQLPEPVAGLWQAMLFRHHAALGLADPALRLLTTWQEDVLGELDLTLAAEVLLRAGERHRAVVLLRRSLEMDPAQGPVRRRLQQLNDPASPIPDVLDDTALDVCVVADARPDALHACLARLADSNLGGAALRVLADGPGEDVRQAARQGRDLFPDREYEILHVPVAIGPAAARNWLFRSVLDKGRDAAALLHASALPEPDWLLWLASTLQRFPEAGAAGLKMVSPDKPPRLLAAHRGLFAADQRLLRLLPPAPPGVYETGVYSYERTAASVDGQCRLLTRPALKAVPTCDIRLSSHRALDAAWDLELRLKGFEIAYCGLTHCVSRRPAPVPWEAPTDEDLGERRGDDVKLYHAFRKDLDRIRELAGLPRED